MNLMTGLVTLPQGRQPSLHKSRGEREADAPGPVGRTPHWESADPNSSPGSRLTTWVPVEPLLLWASVSPSEKEG